MMPVGFSDHSLVLCHVSRRNIKHRSAYWHFNTSLLCDSRFKEGLKFLWNNFKSTKNEFESLRQWWDYGKVKIRQFCQQYTFSVSRDITRSLKDLEIDLVEVETLTDSTGNREQTYWAPGLRGL